MNARVSTLLWLAAISGGGLLAATQAQAGVFDDDEARKAVIQLRDQFNGFQATASQRIDQNSKVQLDIQNQLEGLRQEVARLRGQNEVLQNQVDTLQRQQKDYYADLDARLKKFEPQQVTVDGREGCPSPPRSRSTMPRSSSSRPAISRAQGMRFRPLRGSIRKARTCRSRNSGLATRSTRSVTTRVRSRCCRTWSRPIRRTRKRPMP